AGGAGTALDGADALLGALAAARGVATRPGVAVGTAVGSGEAVAVGVAVGVGFGGWAWPNARSSAATEAKAPEAGRKTTRIAALRAFGGAWVGPRTSWCGPPATSAESTTASCDPLPSSDSYHA